MQLVTEPFTSIGAYLAWAAARPDDEVLVEVVDGRPIVTPSPSGRHQLCLIRLARIITAARPPEHEVMMAPWDWVLWETPHLQLRQPDLVVVRQHLAVGDRLVSPPLLAVEVLSPTSVERDTVAKRHDYARAGLEHYWVVDPETPQIVVYRRLDGELVVTRHARGDGELVVDAPFGVRVSLAALVS